MEKQFEKYAFISYSRQDAKIARELWHRLEKYPYPKHLVDELHRPHDDKFVRPVFLDTADLSVSRGDFSEELKKNIRVSKYLIVLCSEASAQSKFVAQEIETYVQSHNGETSGMIPIIIDRVPEHLPPYIAELLNTRNCPIWNSHKEDKNAKMDNRYCYYHLLEYMLGVDFNKLFSRYLHYTRRRMAIRIGAAFIALLICLLSAVVAWQKEKEVSTFEKGTFPYSLVAGYTNNFLIPLLNTWVDSCTTETPHLLIYMPYRYAELNHVKREKGYDNYIERTYNIEYAENYKIDFKSRKRDLTGHRKKLKNSDVMLYTDNVRTVDAIKEVIIFKQSQPRLFSSLSEDAMTKEYTELFIDQTFEKLNRVIPNNPYLRNVHFITSQHVLDSVMNVIITPAED